MKYTLDRTYDVQFTNIAASLNIVQKRSGGKPMKKGKGLLRGGGGGQKLFEQCYNNCNIGTAGLSLA